MDPTLLDLSTGGLALTLTTAGGRLRLAQLGAGGFAWLHPSAEQDLFAVHAGGQRWSAANLALDGVRDEQPAPGARRVTLTLSGTGLRVDLYLQVYDGEALVELWQTVTNTGDQPLRVERLDTLALHLPDRPAELLGYTGNWGSEFEPQRHALPAAVTLESRSGRSSKGHHPWLAVFDPDGPVLSASVAWSGNWVLRLVPAPEGGCQLSGGLHDWSFYKDLAPGEAMGSAPVSVVAGPSLNRVSQTYARVGRRYWYPRNAFADTLPVEWNHWWPYEDAEISEAVFAENAAVAARMGFEVCVLDAGWFGPAEAGTFWEHYRGDWHLVNRERFPSGLRALSGRVRDHGLPFGMWCEIEGLGVKAAVAEEHPEYVALRDGERIGCVCFGSPAVQDWAYATLARLITENNCAWIKVDSNFDPGAGCNRTDHGHQAGDGLYEHMRGYYRTLERLQRDFPEVIFENCSSGGLRIDHGMLRRTHMTYLSDPDWPEHDLQIFWGASTMLAAETLLHWTYSDWRHLTPPPYQKFNPHDPALTPAKWDYLARISMLGWFGLSQKLPKLPTWLADRITTQIRLYQDHVRRFVKTGDLYRLTGQPRRSGEGDRWAAFQYSLPDKSEHLLFVFRLPGGEATRAIRLEDLAPERTYTVAGLEGEPAHTHTGRALMEAGLVFDGLGEQESALLRIV